MINIMLGVSGSGKSTFIKSNKSENDFVICPDTIREELTGSVSDQSKNYLVWKTAYKRLEERIGSGNIWFDATSLSTDALKEIITRAAEKKEDVTIYVSRDSYDKELCKKRIANDIANKVNRSNVPPEVSDKQYEKFINLVNSDVFEYFQTKYSDINIEVKYF